MHTLIKVRWYILSYFIILHVLVSECVIFMSPELNQLDFWHSFRHISYITHIGKNRYVLPTFGHNQVEVFYMSGHLWLQQSVSKVFPYAGPLRFKQLTNTLKIRILSQISILHLIRYASVILIESLHLYRHMPTSEQCWKKNSCVQWARTSYL